MTTVPQPPSTTQSTTGQASSATAAGSAGGNGPHGDATANGKTAIPPAVPSINGPTIVNGNNAVGQNLREHSRKSSVTISAAGTSGQMPNGGPVAGGKPATGNGIQFGSMNASSSPGASHSTPSAPAGASAAPAAPPVAAPTGNPRITSPATSPSPIPQPPASGGRPPSSIHGQGNGLSFGSLGGDDRRGSMPATMTPNMPNAHIRRESTPSAPGEMSNGMGYNGGRGGYPHQGGRGRGYPHQQYGGQMPYSPNNSFRAPNAPRGGGGMPPQFVPGRGMAPAYQQPPHQVSRSPSMSASAPIHPAGGQMPMQNHQMPQQHFYPQGMPQGQFMGQYDPNFAGYYGAAPYMPQPGMPMPQPFVPQSPRGYPGQPPQPYMQGQYNQQGPQPMSRGSSNRSDQQSGMGPQQPSGQSSGPQPSGTRSTNSPGPKSNTTFQIPTKRSAGIVIKDPNSGAVKTFDKQTTAPTPSKSPANSNAAPTPPPPVSKTPNQTESSHSRTDSQSVKSSSEKAQEMAAAVRKKLEDDKRKEREEEEQKQSGDKDKAGDDTKPADSNVDALADGVNKLKVNEEAPVKSAEPVAEKPAAPEPPKVVEPVTEDKKDVPPEEDPDSDEYWARIEAEEAERERKEAEQEAEYQKKKTVERAEKAKHEAEEAARQDEEMKKAEREAEEAEEARIKKQAQGEVTEDDKDKDQLFASLKKSDHAFQVTKTSSETPPGQETPDESGTATPVSQTSSSMPPPAARPSGKQKPPSLILESTKQVEPPQPSAALQSLRSAKFLRTINDATYPAAIASPNPALNSAAPSGKFRYDKDFLLQFQKVFTEKPSETWTDKVKETVGDTSDTGSARRSNPPGPRPQQRPSGGFNMAVFNMNQGGPGGPGGGGGRFPSGNNKQPLQAFNRNNPMSFPINLNQRTPSNTSIGAPGSPRQTGSRRSKPKRDNDKEAKTMPLTAGMDIRPIQVSEKGWKPTSITQPTLGPPPGGDGYLAPDVVQRKVKASLNKMTPSTFDKISDQILTIVQQSQKETDGRTLLQVIGLTFEKATDEAHWAAMYANFCSKMLGFVQNLQPEIRDETLPLDKNGKVVAGGTLFRKYLLNRCQQDFEAGWQSKLPSKPDGEGGTQEAVMLSDEYYKAAAAKRKGLGLVRFIGELYKLGMLTSRIMHMCVKKLVDFDGMPDEAEVESLASLLKTVGSSLDSEEKARPSMDAYFDRINAMVNLDGLPSRMRFMLMDIIDMRKTGWKVKDGAKGPATLEEIRAQAAQQEREREAQRAADNARRGGGGRMGLGRGDARNFSHGPMPPPQSNTVGMDDLRRLGRGGSRQASSQGPLSLGPTSMFAARGSNPRKPMGGGLLGRGGDDSGGSSRTGTPPAGKEKKEDSTTTNAFSALAGLGDSGEHADHPGSPPSTKGSPPVSHARTVMEQSRTRSKSPLKGEEKA